MSTTIFDGERGGVVPVGAAHGAAGFLFRGAFIDVALSAPTPSQGLHNVFAAIL